MHTWLHSNLNLKFLHLGIRLYCTHVVSSNITLNNNVVRVHKVLFNESGEHFLYTTHQISEALTMHY